MRMCLNLSLSISILQGSLDYETVVSRHKPTPQSKSSSLKLHLSLVNKISDVVGHVTALLTPGSLVAVVMHLLGVAGEEVKTKALKIVARKLEEGKSYFSSDQVTKKITSTFFVNTSVLIFQAFWSIMFAKLFTCDSPKLFVFSFYFCVLQLEKLVCCLQDECLVELLGAVVGVAKSDSAHLLTRHSAVYCVKLLARRLAHGNHHTHLTQVLSTPHFPLSLISSHTFPLYLASDLCPHFPSVFVFSVLSFSPPPSLLTPLLHPSLLTPLLHPSLLTPRLHPSLPPSFTPGPP